MQTYDIYVKGRTLHANSADMSLVRTSVGVDSVHFLFDNDEWLDFPVSVTFSQGRDVVTQVMTVTEVNDSGWVAEGTVIVPYEVIDMVGAIGVTLHGTDNNGNHIITARGTPLYVEEAGDTSSDLEPSESVTPGELEQAYALAMAAANRAASIVDSLQGQIDSIVAAAIAEIEAIYGAGYGPATRASLGLIKVGDGLSVTEDGTLSSLATGSLTDGQLATITRLVSIVDSVVDYVYENGALTSASIKTESLPIATSNSLGIVYPDDVSLTVGEDGMLQLPFSDIFEFLDFDSMPDSIIEELTPFDDIIPNGDEEAY